MRTYVLMTAQGSPRTRFRRAIEHRSLLNAELAAREMGKVTLEEALQLVILYVEQDDPRAGRACVKWLGRLFTEKWLELSLAAQCMELVEGLRGPEAERAAEALDALTRAFRTHDDAGRRDDRSPKA